jgi:predicted house-cleaning noncanonical NTP pyrophosphatase (MazG superfamily)
VKTEHNKLVRDKIPEIIRNSGNQCETTILSNLDYIEALRDKLVEEAKETAIAPPEELAQELADVMEVIDALMAATGIEPEKVREIQKEKRSQRGGFDNRIKLLWTELNNQL